MSTAEVGRAASPGAEMKQLEAQVRTCQLCRLAKTRTNAVPGEGNTSAEVMFIGEGPGYHEDKQGRPFVGAAGQFLNELLDLAGLDRYSVYIANVVKCRPPNNRDPQPDEMAACAPYLERQIALINPKVIVTLGRYSMARFFPGERISQIHGTARLVEGRICVAMYHPAAGLHQGSLADVIRADFRKLPIYIEQARKTQAPRPHATEERVEQALEARAEVVHESKTAAVLGEDLAAERTTWATEDVKTEGLPVPPVEQASTQVTDPAGSEPEVVAAAQAVETSDDKDDNADDPTGNEPGREKNKEYQQLSFF